MTYLRVARRLPLRMPVVFGLLLLISACASVDPDMRGELDRELVSRAVSRATALDARGGRVWCVPFARDASGIEIRGNAGTWWRQAEGRFARSRQPAMGAVMAFSATGSLPLGHVAVVSGIDSERQIRIDHANWRRNKVSLGMTVVDVSAKNDWTRVRVESSPGSLGRVYRIDGFILPNG